MKPILFIPTAGIGSRLLGQTKNINKALVHVNNMPVISHIINGYSDLSQLVVAIGYKGELVKQYLKVAHPDKKIEFIEIDPFIGAGSGLGVTLNQSRSALQSKFIFHACDSLLDRYISSFQKNWMGFSRLPVDESYRTIDINMKGCVERINDKECGNLSSQIYVGVAGVIDYQLFWESFDKHKNKYEIGEVAGLHGMVSSGIQGIEFDWTDIGTVRGLELAREKLYTSDAPVILEKENEAIWFVGDSVIKYSSDRNFIKNRVDRIVHLSGFSPAIKEVSENLYSYEYANGEILSRCVDRKIFKQLLDDCKLFWCEKKITDLEYQGFKKKCLEFYKDKTLERVAKFHNEIDSDLNYQKINGIEVGDLEKILARVDWELLSCGVPVNFHGDFHFENILFDKRRNKFIFLDWRQDFSGEKEFGDIYYDLAKLLHGIIVSHQVIHQEQYEFTRENEKVSLKLMRPFNHVEVEKLFYTWLAKEGYDVRKVRVLTSLIFLNIAALHHDPYSRFLYALGKMMLFDAIGDDET
jgi:thiamine kinase-like enzyme